MEKRKKRDPGNEVGREMTSSVKFDLVYKKGSTHPICELHTVPINFLPSYDELADGLP